LVDELTGGETAVESMQKAVSRTVETAAVAVPTDGCVMDEVAEMNVIDDDDDTVDGAAVVDNRDGCDDDDRYIVCVDDEPA